MRVAYVLSHHARVSQTFVRNEISELARQGDAVRVLAVNRGEVEPPPDQPTDYLFERYAGRDRIARDHAWWAARHPVRYARFLATVRRLAPELHTAYERPRSAWKRLPSAARDLDAWGADVLHAHFAWQGAAAAMALAVLLDRPWVLTVHARDLFADRRHLAEKVSAAARVVTVTGYNRRALLAEHPSLGDVPVIVCGVERPGPEPGPPVDVLAVGRLVEKKGFDTLLCAVALLPARPSVTVVGDGRLRDDLRARAADLGVDAELTGALGHAETLRRMAGAKVLCLPMRVAADGDRDGMPVVVMEAMVRGVPVVASDVAGVGELLDETCARLVPPDDPEAVAAALAELLGDDALRTRLGEAARRRAEERCLLPDQVARLRGVLSDVARGEPRRQRR